MTIIRQASTLAVAVLATAAVIAQSVPGRPNSSTPPPVSGKPPPVNPNTGINPNVGNAQLVGFKAPAKLVVIDGMVDDTPAPGAKTRKIKFGACVQDADNRPVPGAKVQIANQAMPEGFYLNPVLFVPKPSGKGPVSPPPQYNLPPGGAPTCFEGIREVPICTPPLNTNFIATLPANVGGGSVTASILFEPTAIALVAPPANNSSTLFAEKTNYWFQAVSNVACGSLPPFTLKVGTQSFPMKQNVVSGDSVTLMVEGVTVPMSEGGKTLPVTVSMASSSTYSFERIDKSVTVEKTKVKSTLAMPDKAAVGQSFLAKGTLVRASSGGPLEGHVMKVHLSGAKVEDFCTATTDAKGEFSCSGVYSGAPSVALGSGRPSAKQFQVQPPAYFDGNAATTEVVMTTADGSLQTKVPANILDGLIADSKPGGVLLHNYGGGGSPKSAYVPNGSRQFDKADLSNPKPFDIKPLAAPPFFYYLDNIFIRVTDWKLSAPARLTVGVNVEGWQGSGKRIKGRCYSDGTLKQDGECVVGDDKAAPDIAINSISGSFAIDLKPQNGKLAAVVASNTVALNYTCGGIASFVCSQYKSDIDALIRSKLNESLSGKAFTDQLKPINDALLSRFGFTAITAFQLDSDGALLISGKP